MTTNKTFEVPTNYVDAKKYFDTCYNEIKKGRKVKKRMRKVNKKYVIHLSPTPH